jgi:hypothetical protein
MMRKDEGLTAVCLAMEPTVHCQFQRTSAEVSSSTAEQYSQAAQQGGISCLTLNQEMKLQTDTLMQLLCIVISRPRMSLTACCSSALKPSSWQQGTMDSLASLSCRQTQHARSQGRLRTLFLCCCSFCGGGGGVRV